MNLTKLQILAMCLLLAVVHIGLGLLPTPPFSNATNLVLYFVNLFVLFSSNHVLDGRSTARRLAFLIGYFALFVVTILLLNKPPLFVLLAVLFVAFFGTWRLFALYCIFVVSFVFLQPFAFEAIIPLMLLFFVWNRVQGRVPGFVLACLMSGLVGLSVLLFPLLHLGLQDSVQTLLKLLSRSDVRESIVTSLLTSTISTLLLVLWGVPFAYGLARSQFKGKRFVEEILDIPILVPQSVAGVALIVLLGPGSVLGSMVEGLGLGVSGTMMGIVIAQLFVSAPFVVKASVAAFESIPERYEQAARTIGASPMRTFLSVALPMASRGILIGTTLSWARSISEFGCIVLFASSPLTTPVLVHTEFLRAGASESRPLAMLFLVVCLWFFLLFRVGGKYLPSGWLGVRATRVK